MVTHCSPLPLLAFDQYGYCESVIQNMLTVSYSQCDMQGQLYEAVWQQTLCPQNLDRVSFSIPEASSTSGSGTSLPPPPSLLYMEAIGFPGGL